MGAQSDREFFVVQAAQEIRDRIRRDAGFKPKRVQELLGLFEENFLNADFDLAGAVRRYGRGGRYAAELTARKLGIAPGAYLTRCRLDFAKILLRKTALKIWRIASVAGFSNRTHFSRSFNSSVGMPPTAYRRRSRALRGDLPGATEMDPVEFLEQLYLGSLEPEQVRLHSDRIRKANPGAFPSPDPPPHDRGEGQVAAERVLDLLRRSDPRHHRLILEAAHLPTPALADLLLKESRVQGRADRKLGIHLARLSLDALEPCAETLGESLHDRRTVAWAWVGLAHTFDLDQAGAELAFAQGRREWATPRTRPDLLAYAELIRLESHLRLLQRRYETAEALLDEAVPLFREGRASEGLITALIAKSNLEFFRAEHASALPLLTEASELLTPRSGPVLCFAVHANRAANLVGLGEYQAALEVLPEAEAACERIENNRLFLAQLAWTKGLAEHGLGRIAQGSDLLLEARRELIDLEETDHATVVSLDLAIRWLEAKEYAPARDILLETLPFFKALEHHRELCVSLKVLEEACKAELFEVGVLKELRSAIDKLRVDPAHLFHRKA